MRLWVERTNESHADCLKTYGIATLLNVLFLEQGSYRSRIDIKQTSSHYLIDIDDKIANKIPQLLEDFEPPVILQILDNNSTERSTHSVIRLKNEKEKRDQYQNYIRENKSRTTNCEEILSEREHQHYHLYSLYQEMKAFDGHNNFAKEFQNNPGLLRIVFQWIFEILTNPLPHHSEKEETWKKLVKQYEKEKGTKVSLKSSVTALSFFNPIQAKGVNLASARGIKPKNSQNFVLDEFFKTIGILQGALGQRIPSGTRFYDCVLQVIDPKHIAISKPGEIIQKIKDSIRAPSRQYFELSTLLTVTLQVLEDIQREEQFKPGLRVAEYIRGLYSTYYKGMEKAKTVMNLSYFHLPNWVVIDAPEDFAIYKKIFTEIAENISPFTRKENYYLLDQLNPFLSDLITFISTGQLKPYLSFLHKYHFLVFEMLIDKKYWLSSFTISHILEVIMRSNKKYASIVTDKGFLNIARAIYNSTMSLQYQEKQNRQYPVHYDLQHELKRTAPYPEKFIAALANFISTYNSENARVFEQNKVRGIEGYTRINISETDLKSVIMLIDDFGSETVGNLLVAFGFAKKGTEGNAMNSGQPTD